MFALLGGSLLFLAVLVPILAWQSRRYGRISLLRLLGAGACSIYAVALLAYTLLPLPVEVAHCADPQLIPFHFLVDIARETEGLSPLGVLTSRATMQVVFNVALFVPLGIIARRFAGLGFWATLSTGFAVSLLIELTQLTGVFGIYECAFRVADVDDLLANTLGAMLGAAVAPALLFWMPRADALERTRGLPRPVTVWRRWLGMLVDLLVYTIGTSVATLGLAALRLVVTGEQSAWAAVPTLPEALLIGLLPLAPFVLAALSGSGASPGQRVVWLEPRFRSTGVGPRLVRALAVAGAYALSHAADLVADAVPGSIAAVVAGLLGGLGSLVVLVAVLSVLWTRGRRGLSYVLASAELADARAAAPVASARG